jgi:lysozyme
LRGGFRPAGAALNQACLYALGVAVIIASTSICWADPTVDPKFFIKTFPTLEKNLPPGSLLEQLEGQKAVLPQGVQLRPVNKRGLTLLEAAEGFIDHLYNDSANYCTIGYGRLIKKARCDGTELPQYQGVISKQTAEQWLVMDLGQAQITVMTSVTAPLNDDQYAALCDFVYNVGGNNFQRSTLLQVINAKQFDRVPPQFDRWVTAGGKTWPGLVKRRNDEVALFFYGQRVPKAVPIPNENLSPIDIRSGESPS